MSIDRIQLFTNEIFLWIDLGSQTVIQGTYIIAIHR
jgi:hypothetical protein